MEQWLDNTDETNLGIVKWAMELLPDYVFSAVPWFHKKLYLRLLSLYDPTLTNKYERLYELISFRESAKSTAANMVFVSYVIANNGKKIKMKRGDEIVEFIIDERLVCIVSETAGSAEDFTVRIRDAFTISPTLHYYYKFHIEDALDNITGQWTRSAFKFNNCFVLGIGTGQQIRGKIRGPSRPTLLIADDIYSENNTVSEERRDKIKRWWNNSAINTVDNIRGKVVVLGTILHDDTILVELRDNPQWTTDIITLMDPDRFHDLIREHLKIDTNSGTCSLPHEDVEDKQERMRAQKAYFNKLQDEADWGLAWPERIDLYFIALKYKEAMYNNTVAGFYQEYFHITTPPEERRFRKEFFQTLPKFEFKSEFGYNWIKIEGDDQWRNCVTELGVDLAGGGAGGDDVVITVIATLADRRILVLHQSIGKYTLRDDTHQDTSIDRRLYRVILDKSQLRRVGVIDECFRLWLRYKTTTIKVGQAGEEAQVVTLMQQVFQENRAYNVHILGRPQTTREGKKEERIKNTLLPYYETRMVYHTPGLHKLEYQLEFLGKSKNDDCADSLECAMWQVQFPYSIASIEDLTPATSVDHFAKYSREFNLKNNWREYA